MAREIAVQEYFNQMKNEIINYIMIVKLLIIIITTTTAI